MFTLKFYRNEKEWIVRHARSYDVEQVNRNGEETYQISYVESDTGNSHVLCIGPNQRFTEFVAENQSGNAADSIFRETVESNPHHKKPEKTPGNGP